MKLLEVFNIINESQFLIERDVLNANEMKQWAQQMGERVQNPPERQWFVSQLYKYLINRYNEFSNIDASNMPAESPEWLQAKVAAGEPVVVITPQQDVMGQAEGIADWLNAEPQNNLRMSWEDAVRAQAEWHDDIARASRVTELTDEQMEGLVTLIEYPDGFKWVDVQTEVCLQHEGTMMGHCVGQGGYTQGVKEGKTKIISLRDPKGLAHATIEGVSENSIIIPKGFDPDSPQKDLFAADNAIEQSFVDMEIRQIKGKENKPVVQKYRDYVIDFLTKFGITKFSDWGGRGDLTGAGIYELQKGGFVNAEDAGKKVMEVGDNTWYRIDGSKVKLGGYEDNLSGKWVLADKNGHSIGEMREKSPGLIASIGNELLKPEFKEYIIAAFDTGLTLERASWNRLKDAELAVTISPAFKLGNPQDVGQRLMKTSKGVIYVTNDTNRDRYWLIKNGKIVTTYELVDAADEDANAATIIFDEKYGWPSGNITEFLNEVSQHRPIVALHIPNSGSHLLSDLKYDGKGKEIMEEDGIKYYESMSEDNITWYDIVDVHGHIIVETNLTKIKIKLAPTREIAGFYLIYLINYLEEVDGLDVGEMTTYNSLTREILDETGWFKSLYDDAWMVEDNDYPIHMWEEKHYSDGESEDNDKETTMGYWFDTTQLRDYGLEDDFYAKMFDDIYHDRRIAWDDEHEPDVYDEVTIVREEWWADNNGDADTVTHPVNGGSMRVKR